MTGKLRIGCPDLLFKRPLAPIVNYKSPGLNTDISMREAGPVVVGTIEYRPLGRKRSFSAKTHLETASLGKNAPALKPTTAIA